jgi:hypothetical protein
MFHLLQIYLSQFGYLNPQVRNPNSGTLMEADALKKAIVEFQAFAGLNITGDHLRDSFLCTGSSTECHSSSGQQSSHMKTVHK